MSDYKQQDELTRRMFMSRIAYSTMGVSVGPLIHNSMAAPAHTGTAKQVVVINAVGGMSHLDTFDPKPGNKKVMVETETVKTIADGVYLGKTMRALGPHMKDIAVINNLATTQGGHGGGQYYWHTGYPQRSTILHPSFGTWANHLIGPINKSLPANVAIGAGSGLAKSGFMNSKLGPLLISDPTQGVRFVKRPDSISQTSFNDRMKALKQMNTSFQKGYKYPDLVSYDKMYDDAIRLMNAKDLVAFDLSKEPEESASKYGKNELGRSLLLARRLIEAGVRYVEVKSGGWDHHVDIFPALQEKGTMYSMEVANFLKDLKQRGLLQETLVAGITEFGRTPKISRNGGRQHFPVAFSAWMAGGGVRGGQKIGKSDKDGFHVDGEKNSPEDYLATVAHALGIDHQKPSFSPGGRPFKIGGAKGKPIKGVLS